MTLQEFTPRPERGLQLGMARIQIKRYKRKYLSKAVYQCTSYFVYVDREVAKRFIGKDLRMIAEENAIVFRVVNRAAVAKTGIETSFLHESKTVNTLCKGLAINLRAANAPICVPRTMSVADATAKCNTLTQHRRPETTTPSWIMQTTKC